MKGDFRLLDQSHHLQELPWRWKHPVPCLPFGCTSLQRACGHFRFQAVVLQVPTAGHTADAEVPGSDRSEPSPVHQQLVHSDAPRSFVLFECRHRRVAAWWGRIARSSQEEESKGECFVSSKSKGVVVASVPGLFVDTWWARGRVPLNLCIP